MANLQPSVSPIASRTKTCVDLFERLNELTLQPDEQQNDGIPTSEAVDALGRFRIWAGNIGAFQRFDSKSSLDYRLRDARKIVVQIVGLLDDLAESLEDACSIVSDERANRTSSTLEIGPVHVDEGDGEDLGDGEEISEIKEIFSSITEAIHSLFRFSIIIRNNTNRDRYAKATAASLGDPIPDQFDINHVREKFPALQAKEKECLIEKLGKAITQRRQYLKYCREHHHKTSVDFVTSKVQSLPKDTGLAPVHPATKAHTLSGMSTLSKPPSTLAQTQASTLILNSSQTVEEDVPEESQSQTSYATSNEEESSTSVLHVVHLEDISKGLNHFECPYCWQIQTCTTQRAWKKHVLSDLKPYVCTYEDCDLKLFSDRQTWFSHELKDHRREWHCRFCTRQPFDSMVKYQKHLSHRHPQSFAEDQLPALLEMSQHSLGKVSPSDCPFCDDWEQRLRSINTHIPLSDTLVVTQIQFKHHVGAHMEQLALFAIPRGYTEAGDADSGNAAPGSDLSLPSSHGGDLAKSKAAEELQLCEDVLRELMNMNMVDDTFLHSNGTGPLADLGRYIRANHPAFGDLSEIAQRLSSGGWYSTAEEVKDDIDVMFGEFYLAAPKSSPEYVKVKDSATRVESIWAVYGLPNSKEESAERELAVLDAEADTLFSAEEFGDVSDGGDVDIAAAKQLPSHIPPGSKMSFGSSQHARGQQATWQPDSTLQTAFGLALTDEVIEDMIKCVQNRGPIQLSLGDNPTLHYGTKTLHLSTSADWFTHDLYRSPKKGVTDVGDTPYAQFITRLSQKSLTARKFTAKPPPKATSKSRNHALKDPEAPDSEGETASLERFGAFNSLEARKDLEEGHISVGASATATGRKLRGFLSKFGGSKTSEDQDRINEFGIEADAQSQNLGKNPVPPVFLSGQGDSRSSSRASTRKTRTVGGFIADNSDHEQNAATPEVSSSQAGSQWPLDGVLLWLANNHFSRDWQETFKALNICGSVFLGLGSGNGGRGNLGMMHSQIYPRLARECSMSGTGWDQAREREEGKRMRRLISMIMPGRAEGSIPEYDKEGTEAQATPAKDRPRVTTMIRGSPFDITDLGIDADFLAELPEEAREAVIMSAVADRRSQTAANSAQPSEIDQEPPSQSPMGIPMVVPIESKQATNDEMIESSVKGKEPAREHAANPFHQPSALSSLDELTTKPTTKFEETKSFASPGSAQVPRVAYLYDIDDQSKPIPGSKQSARTKKEKPKVSQRDSRTGKQKTSHSDNRVSAEADESVPPAGKVVEVATEEEVKLERRKTPGRRFARTAVSPPSRPRPPISRRVSEDDLSRIRSGYGTRPPLSTSAYYQQQPIVAPSYPPPSPNYFRSTATHGTTSESDPIQRPTSAYGVKDVKAQQISDNPYDDGYLSGPESPPKRRPSIRYRSVKSKGQLDYAAMPPPPRPGILRQPIFGLFEDAPRPQAYREQPSRQPGSVSYILPESDRVRVVEVNSGRRRKSYYDQPQDSTPRSNYEEKTHQATYYQEDVTGPTIPLTADALKRQQRRQADSNPAYESDYRKSATTRETRAGSGDDENVTIKVTGMARVMVGGAQIDCTDGGEIEIKRRDDIRNGSVRAQRGSGSEDEGMQNNRMEERRSRDDRPTGRSRMTSKSNKGYTRTAPEWI